MSFRSGASQLATVATSFVELRDPAGFSAPDRRFRSADGRSTIGEVSVEIVRLLAGSGTPETEIEALLSRSVEAGKSVARVLSETGSPLLERIDRELTRRDVPSMEIVRAAADEVQLLPAGLCERLGVVPVRRDARSGRVDVAVLDALDPHLAEELEFHLGSPVRTLRARPDAIEAALRAEPPARLASGPPLPLIRKASVPGGGSPADEPVLVLSRAKVAAAPPAPLPVGPSQPLEEVLSALDAAASPEELVSLLVRGMAPASALVLALRTGVYEGRAGSAGMPVEAVRAVRVPAATASVVETAARSGFYLGALPFTPAHASLRALFGEDPDAEVYVRPVVASGRASLVLLSGLLPVGPTVDATRRADELARAAGRSLERILLRKKRGG